MSIDRNHQASARGSRERVSTALLIGTLLAACIWGYRSLGNRDELESSTCIAVLPFSNISDNSSHDYIATGMSAALTTQLGDLERLEVPPSDIWNLIDPDQSVTRLAARLGFDRLLAGELRIDRGRVQVRLRLIDPSIDKNPKLFQIDGSLENLIEVQHQLMASVAAELGTPLTARQKHRARKALTRSHKAYDDFLRGSTYLSNLAQPRGPRFASDLLRRAVQLDPLFALAHVDLSRALWRTSSAGEGEAQLLAATLAAERALDRVPGLRAAVVAEMLARKGLNPDISCTESVRRLAPRRVDASAVLIDMAASYLQVGALQTAEDCLRSAVDLDSADGRSWSRLGDFLWRTGRLDEATNAYQQAVDVSPSEAIWPRLSLALVSLDTGDYASAIENFEASGGDFYDAEMAYDLAMAYSASEDLSKSEELMRAAIVISPHRPRYYDRLGDLLVVAGRPEEAEKAYLTALELTDQATGNDTKPDLDAFHALIAAKAGVCERAVPAATILRRHGPETAERCHQLAQVFSICRQKALALEAISVALANGYSATRVLSDRQFSWLLQDDDFQALVPDSEPTLPLE